MTLLPEAHDLPPPAASRGRTAKPTKTTRHQLIAAMTDDPDLTVIIMLCAIALLITINLIIRFPDFGAVIEQYNQF